VQVVCRTCLPHTSTCGALQVRCRCGNPLIARTVVGGRHARRDVLFIQRAEVSRGRGHTVRIDTSCECCIILSRGVTMTLLQTVTVKLPQKVYRRLERAAKTTDQSFDTVLLQTIHGNLPPSLDNVPIGLRDEMRGLLRLSDDDLWAVASGSVDPKQWRRHQRLLRKNTVGTLTEREKDELASLRAETDRYVLRQSFALALLRWRGHTVPLSSPQANHART